MLHRLVLVSVFTLLVMLTSDPAVAAKRIALVIGNGAYPNIGTLVNPPNDARLMAGTLRQLGFEVIEEIDVAQKPLKKAIKAFGDRLNKAGKDAIGLFYYAGHGVQVNGENYIIPVNVEINDEADVDIESVSMRAVLQNMTFAGNNMNIIIMDACRNNPFKRSFRSAGRGLARMDASKGTIIAYATSPGDVAADGSGMNSPYTTALTTNMMKPGITVERMFKEVRNSVIGATDSAQVPWESSSLTGGDFYFSGSSSTVQDSTQPAKQNVDLIFWQSIQNSKNAADYATYLNQFPQGIFAALAQVKIDQLNNQTPTPVANVAPQISRASTGLNGFIPGKYKVKVLAAKRDCGQVKFRPMTATETGLKGSWRHPDASGTVTISLKNEMVSVRWTGNHIKSNRELVQISGNSLLIEVRLKHTRGSCSISFKLADVLK